MVEADCLDNKVTESKLLDCIKYVSNITFKPGSILGMVNEAVRKGEIGVIGEGLVLYPGAVLAESIRLGGYGWAAYEIGKRVIEYF